MTRIKICGVTSISDALLCAEAGVDALGLNFYPPSPRYVSVERGKEIATAVPPFVSLVGVFVGNTPEGVGAIARECGLHYVQIYNTLSPESILQLARPVIRAIRVRSAEDLRNEMEYFPGAAAYLLDTFRVGKRWGGTGEIFDWRLACEAARSKRVILAGGLTPANVGEAIRTVEPYAVDVATGVESSPGRKDPGLVRRFVEAVRETDRSLSDQR